MERQQELKVLLKRWEAEFLRERRRKPSQADIEEAPEETRRLYREYRELKKREKNSGETGNSGAQKTPQEQQVEDSGFWGSHLNRSPKCPGRRQSHKPRAGTSQIYGMKLKAKLGTSGKEPPLTPNPRKIPKPPQPQQTPELGAEIPPENPEKPQNSQEFLPPSLGKIPDFSPVAEKFRRLRRSVAQTLGSLDPAWLRRCEESQKIQRGFLGNDPKSQREFPEIGAKSQREFPEIGAKSQREFQEIDPKSQQEFPEIDPKSQRECEEALGHCWRKRPRAGCGAAEAPAKLRRGCEPGTSAIRQIREKKQSQRGAGDGAGEIPQEEEEEEKPKATRRPRAPRGNFVRLNLKRKTYTRASQRGKFLRRQVWKQKWRKKFGGGSDHCFRCGGKGHWAAECPGKKFGSFPEEIPEEKELLTLEEVARRSNGDFIPEIPDGSSTENSQLPPDSLDFPQPEFSPPSPPPPPMDPLYPPNPDGTVPDPPEEVLEALRTLGYDSFRPHQAEAVMRVLSGISTLLLLPTGSGKSLCYQLPAFLYHRRSRCISLIISPLVSLMDDQVSGLPSALKAVCIHSNLTQSQREAAIQKVRSGQAQILLLSPESVTGSGFFSRFFRHFPPVAFACLDEAHCISQWSHNFRPAYLRVCKVLRERLGVRCFLGLTATATVATARDVAKHLGIPEGNPPIGGFGIPENLRLSVSVEADLDQAVLRLLRKWSWENPGSSVLLYCTRREESERLAELIRAHFPRGPGWERSKGTKEHVCVSAAYHAGLSPLRRSSILRRLRAGAVWALCGTAALGLGLHRGAPGAVLHRGGPGSLQAFVQEIGRAGRDGRAARCHLCLHQQGEDFLELRRHIHENSVDFWAVKALVLRVFAPCKCPEIPPEIQDNSQEGRGCSRRCRGHERSVPVQELEQELDLRQEGIETLLSLLELQPGQPLQLLPPLLSRCRLRGSPGRLRQAAQSCPPLRLLLAGGVAGIPGISGIPGALEFDAVALSDALGWESGAATQSLAAAGKKFGIQVEFREFSFHFRARGDLSPPELDSLTEFLHAQGRRREKAELRRLQGCFRVLHSVAAAPEEAQERRLRELLRQHFLRDQEEEEEEEEENPGIPEEQEQEIRAEIRKLLEAFPEERFTGRAVARIFHGIGSPRFPAPVFGRQRRFWRRLLPVDFGSLARLASLEILARR